MLFSGEYPSILAAKFPIVQDVDWNRQNENIFASVGDDKMLLMYVVALDRPPAF